MTDNNQDAYSAPSCRLQAQNLDTSTPTKGFLSDARCTEVAIPSQENPVGPQASWGRLPLEIQAEIFLMCLPVTQRDRAPSQMHAPYLLTRICRAWLKVVVELPTMWSTIALVCTGDAPISPLQLRVGTRHLEMSIARSRAAPLQLYTRTEFIAHPESFNCIQRVSQQISRLVIVYPPAENGLFPPYFPHSNFFSVPNLKVLEVHNGQPLNYISRTDLSHFDHLIKTSQTLKRHISRDRTPKVLGPPVIANMSHLEVLTLEEIVPLSLCLFLLQNIPTLRKLSVKVTVLPDDRPTYENATLLSALSDKQLFKPFTHQCLQYLAISHHRSDLSAFFDIMTLPSLHFLVLDFRYRRNVPVSWPHQHFVKFLRRSGCRLKSFHILDQPISSSQLLEILRLPNLADSLEYLGIQHYEGAEDKAVDNDLLEQLTLRPAISHVALGDGPTLPPSPEAVPSALCPNIERLLLFVPLKGFTLSKMISMFESRLPSDTLPTTAPHTYLKHIEIDLYDEMKASLGSLSAKGLVFSLFEPMDSNPMPPNEEQQKLWGRYLTEGLDDEVYDHETGTWRPSDLTLAML